MNSNIVYLVKITLKSCDLKILDKAAKIISSSIIDQKLLLSGPIPMPNKNMKFAVRRAPQIYKRSFEKFALVTHKRILYIKDIAHVTTIKFLSALSVPKMVMVKIKFIKS